MAIILVISELINTANKTASSDYYYSSTAEDYQYAFESCHSTYEHKQALFSYDINNDNYLSSYEAELFLNAHPRVTNDKQFMNWVESKFE